MRQMLVVAALIALSGCAAAPTEERPFYTFSQVIDFSRRPADWPELHVEVIAVPQPEVEKQCGPSMMPAGFAMLGCAIPNFCRKRCTVWIAPKGLKKHELDLVVGHERAHCRGYDHPSDSVMRDLWEAAKARGCGPD